MSDYRVFETDQFLGDLKKDFGGYRRVIEHKLRSYVYPQLREEPHFGPNIKRLRNFSPKTWRYRIGGYRFFYEVSEDQNSVFMIAAESREDSY